MNEYVCSECRSQKEERDEELYCICRQPYDESQFYIGCDRCQDWFHGRCVGISQTEADNIEKYLCPNCQSSKVQKSNTKDLTNRDYDQLRRLLRQLQSHKMAWPFLDPVSEIDAPDYYRVIKEPMDLSTLDDKMRNRQYRKLGEFIGDVTKIFDNCRFYNPSDSPFFQCADVLEKFFVQKIKMIQQTISL
ncbi:nucleosome-remodeling factor subunit NURF301-like [Saccoglossus kowalevskii]